MWLLQTVEKKPDAQINDAIDAVSKNAKDKWGLDYEGEYPKEGIGISTLRPYHVENTTTHLPNNELNVWRIDITTAQTWQDWINTTLDVNLYVIVAGLYNNTPSPSLTELTFKANGTDLPVENIEQMYAFENCQAYFSKPFSVSPENNLTARIYGNTAQTEELGMLGYAIAKRNLLIESN